MRSRIAGRLATSIGSPGAERPTGSSGPGMPNRRPRVIRVPSPPRLPPEAPVVAAREIVYAPARPRLMIGPCMSSTKTPSAARSSSYENAGSAAINAMVARTAPAILGLLADGVPRPKAAIVEALAGRHHRQDVLHALIRLAVTCQVSEAAGKYTLGTASEP